MTTNSSDSNQNTVPVLRSVTSFEAVDRTFAQMLRDRAELEPDEAAFYSWANGTARATSWSEYLDAVTDAALGLHRLGIMHGDRVAIMSSTRGEWVVAALAILALGAVPVGVYPTSSAAEVSHALFSTGAVAMFAENSHDCAAIAAVASDVPSLRLVVGFDCVPDGFEGGIQVTEWVELLDAGRSSSMAEPLLFSQLIAAGHVDDLAALFFTSGSTGAPKAVKHTHRTLQYSVLGFAASYPDIGVTRHDMVGFLGLSHVAPALLGVFAPVMTKLVMTFCSMEQRPEVLRAVRPNTVLWPPRMHEKLASEALEELSESGPVFRLRYAAAMKIARRVSEYRWAGRPVPRYLNTLNNAAAKYAFIPLRAKVGMDRITVSWTASGTMTPEVAALWHMWGLDLRELFGTTETCGSVIAQWDRAFPTPGTIGKALPDPRWQARVSDDGELELRSPCLFEGYWDNREATESAFEDDWYRTGDLVEIDAHGEIKIIGRLKDVLKTSGGKSVSPQPIEVRLKASSLIEEAIVVGEGRKYLTVLLSISDEAKSMGSQERDTALRVWIEEVNTELSRPLQLKKFKILPRALSAASGELTAKATIRRAAILESFAELIDELYDGDEQNEIARQARYAPMGRK
ncbi:AMP-dependent synthetase/ligase [Rhodococcoides fascians]|uniref:AMP-dependent synthetase/ligase n=1 Tax=Rhodococcoides fascians TaxID=1828 RepID=UPI0027DB4193|nr:AMP-binding protein [Rhodococcus fascians]